MLKERNMDKLIKENNKNKIEIKDIEKYMQRAHDLAELEIAKELLRVLRSKPKKRNDL